MLYINSYKFFFFLFKFKNIIQIIIFEQVSVNVVLNFIFLYCLVFNILGLVRVCLFIFYLECLVLNSL